MGGFSVWEETKMANGELIKEKVSKKELVDRLNSCSAALGIVIAILADDCHEKVADKVLGINGVIGSVIYDLKNRNLEE